MIMDTSSLLSMVEIEKLNSDEIIDVKSKLDKYEVYV